MSVDELDQPIRDDDLHLFLFGPGYGESVVVRVPPGLWVVIDSLIQSDGEVPAERLLRSSGGTVALAVLTHPHDDHAPGLERAFAASPDAVVAAVAPYVTDPQSWIYTADAERLNDQGTVEHAVAAIRDRWERNESHRWTLRAGEERTFGDARVLVLFPDDQALSQLDASKKKGANHWASPVLLEWKGLRFLFGSDLEAQGWAQIHDAGTGHPLGQHAAFKVAHHASLGAIHSCQTAGGTTVRSWSATPWNRGHKLPRFEEGQGVEALLRSVPDLHLTSAPFARPQALGGDRLTRSQLAMAARPGGGALAGTPLPPPPADAGAWWHFRFSSTGLEAATHGASAFTVRET